VTHGHFLVNGKKVNIPSYRLRVSDVVELREASRQLAIVNDSISKIEHRGVPSWLELDAINYKGKVLQIPAREDIQLTAQEQLIVELYSK
jgi:small subunit ribosomal protein S4